MTGNLPLFLGVLALYVIVVVLVGLAANRRAARSPEEYFLAGSNLGTVVLFMALFGTNCTAFVLVGVPGRAYHDGVAVFGLNAPIVALGIPLSFWAIGVPARRMALRLGALTPAELYARRFDSRALGQLLFALYTLYTLPYMVTAVDGAAHALASATDGIIGPLAGGAFILAVALIYTSLGGMRATAWTNVIQGALFMAFMVVAFFMIAHSLGGFGSALEAVKAERPELLTVPDRGLYRPPAWASWSLAISLTVIAFPHMLVRLFAARSEATIKRVCRLYPLALVALWLPAVMLGVFGAIEFPGLAGSASDTIFARMVTAHLPPFVAACGFLAVLAAVMSTLDAQLLTLGSMLSRDVLRRRTGADPRRDVRLGRAFGGLLALLVFAFWRFAGDSIFAIASIAFSGYVTLTPVLFFGVRWRRFSRAGAFASLLVGNAVYFVAIGASPVWERAAMSPSWGGFLPVFWAFVAALVSAVVVSLALPDVDGAARARAYG